METLCKITGHFYVLKGEQTGKIYGIWRKYKNRDHVLREKAKFETEADEPIKLWID